MALKRDSPLRLRFPADPKSATVLRERLAVWLDELGADDAEVFDIAVAATEAFANAVRHPYAPTDDVVDVNAVNDGKMVTIVVQDYGSWAATEDGDECGRGLPLMQKLMDSVRVDARIGGTSVTLRRRLARPSLAC
jgi:anti-sigma regulatory factor (Ser/Thr protein kinase)